MSETSYHTEFFPAFVHRTIYYARYSRSCFNRRWDICYWHLDRDQEEFKLRSAHRQLTLAHQTALDLSDEMDMMQSIQVDIEEKLRTSKPDRNQGNPS